MPFNFPDSPTVGQQFTPIAGTIFQYNGYGWDFVGAAFQPLDADLTALAALTGTNTIYFRSAPDSWSPVVMGGNMTFSGGVLNSTGGGGGASVTISDTPPVSPADGALWWESDTGLFSISYNDGTSTQWVAVNGQASGAGIGDAPVDNAAYGRRNAAWSQVVHKAGDTMTGNLAIVPPTGSAQFSIVAPVGTNLVADLVFSSANGTRWIWRGAQTSAETGGNAGSDLVLFRFNDAGAIVDAPIQVTRSNGVMTLSAIPIAPTAAAGTNNTQLATTQFVTAAVAALIPAGTYMVFHQTNAPTGWTKFTGYNDRALRVVNGTVTSGGSVAFSTVFGRTSTDLVTLTTAHLPPHAHTVTDYSSQAYSPGYGFKYYAMNDSINVNPWGAVGTGSAGSGIGFYAGIDMRVTYVDVIIASKN